jgi:hypothetical protein
MTSTLTISLTSVRVIFALKNLFDSWSAYSRGRW